MVLEKSGNHRVKNEVIRINLGMERDTLLSEKGRKEKSMCKHTKKFRSGRKESTENNV